MKKQSYAILNRVDGTYWYVDSATGNDNAITQYVREMFKDIEGPETLDLMVVVVKSEETFSVNLDKVLEIRITQEEV